ncbi:MAG: diguanylate cyclase [Rhizobacter sp.]
MRVQTQLRITAGLALVVVLVVAAASWIAVSADHRAEAEQDRARNAARHAAALLLLTQEYPRYFEPRVAQQWRERQAALVQELAGRDDDMERMRQSASRLPMLFDRLSELPDEPETAFTARRSDFIVDQLINETQSLADSIYRWSRDTSAEGQAATRRFRWIGILSLLAVLGLLVGQTAVIVRRLLDPLDRIERASARVERGDFDAKVGLDSQDELGRVARQFDAMTATLHERRAQLLAEMARREAIERRLTDITNTIPALVGYFHADERLEFANGPAIRLFGLDEARLDGYTMRTALGDALYALHAPYLPRLADGQKILIEDRIDIKGHTMHFQAHLVPDIGDDGGLKGFYAMTFDVTALKLAEERMSQLARVDTLTELPNRRQFEERLADAMARSRRSRRPIALMYLDIDHFKGINDSLGHQGGDVVLQEFARRLRASVRTTDTVARLAGDEFVVVLEGLNVGQEAEGVAQKIIDAMTPPVVVNGTSLDVTTSIGIVVSTADEPDATALTARADDALYRAKRAGRNRFAVSTI